jgi:hypothetical protein
LPQTPNNPSCSDGSKPLALKPNGGYQMSAQMNQPNNLLSLLKTEIHQINLARTEYASITLTDRNGNEIARIEFERNVEATPQLSVLYFDKEGNLKQAVTTFDIDA